MPDKKPLSDDEVFELLADALMLFHNRAVATPLGRDVLIVMIKQIETMQRAMIIVKEGSNPEPPRDPEWT